MSATTFMIVSKLSRNLFLTEFQLAMNEFNKNLSDKEISQNDRINLAKQSLSKLTTRYLFLNLANEMNLKISQNVIKESILNNELLKGRTLLPSLLVPSGKITKFFFYLDVL